MQPLTAARAARAPSARARVATDASTPSSSETNRRASNARFGARVARARQSVTARAQALDGVPKASEVVRVDGHETRKRALDDEHASKDSSSKRHKATGVEKREKTARSFEVTVRGARGARRDAGEALDASEAIHFAAPRVSASARELRTRFQCAQSARRRENERGSALLGTLCEDALWLVCSRLSARDLAALEQTSAYFRDSARATNENLGLCERVARERVRGARMGDMPPFYRCVSRSTWPSESDCGRRLHVD